MEAELLGPSPALLLAQQAGNLGACLPLLASVSLPYAVQENSRVA